MTTPERLCGCKRTRADEDGVYDYIDVEEEILRATRRTLCHILVPMIAARMMILDLSRRRHEINSIPNRRQQGASKKQIERIPLKKLKTSPDRSCCICLEDFAAGDEVKTLPCEHYFHSRVRRSAPGPPFVLLSIVRSFVRSFVCLLV